MGAGDVLRKIGGAIVGIFKTAEHEFGALLSFLGSVYGPEVIAHAVTAVRQAEATYIAGAQPGWEDAVVNTLKHEFVASSLVEKFGLQASVSHLVTEGVHRLFQIGDDKLNAISDAAVAAADQAAGAGVSIPPKPPA